VAVDELSPVHPEDVERVWSEFWVPIVAPEGRLRTSQVKRELYDYWRILDQCVRLAEAAGVDVDGISGLGAVTEQLRVLRRRGGELEVLEAKMRAVEASAEALVASGKLTQKAFRELLDRPYRV
jgi:hypothetical protein